MDVIDNKTDRELLESVISEIAKSTSEIRCARGDIEKAQGRIKFSLMVLHKLIERQGD